MQSGRKRKRCHRKARNESGESSDCKEEGKAPGERNSEETERVEIPPKGSEVVLPAGANGEGGRAGCGMEEGEKGKGGSDRSGKGSMEGREKMEKKCKATKS